MMMVIVSLALLSGCAKEEEIVDPAPVYPDYTCLKQGNYWIYERFNIDTLGVVTPLGIFDSCYVEKDTLIHGETFAKLVKPYPYMPKVVVEFLRDSLHYLVDHTGNIRFSSEDFSSIFRTYYIVMSYGDTAYTATVEMDDINEHIAVPAGEFTTMNCKTTYKVNPEFAYYTNKVANTKYAKDVGLVVETLPMYATDPNKKERWLVRYHVN